MAATLWRSSGRSTRSLAITTIGCTSISTNCRLCCGSDQCRRRGDVRSIGSFSCWPVLLACVLLVASAQSYAQDDEVEPGHSIGKVSINGDLIVFELDDGALGTANLF